jgi:hypothetical protein
MQGPAAEALPVPIYTTDGKLIAQKMRLAVGSAGGNQGPYPFHADRARLRQDSHHLFDCKLVLIQIQVHAALIQVQAVLGPEVGR